MKNVAPKIRAPNTAARVIVENKVPVVSNSIPPILHQIFIIKPPKDRTIGIVYNSTLVAFI